MNAPLTVLAAALAAAVLLLAGCGVGEAGAEGEVSETADTYLRALAEGDFATACAQLTPEVTAELGDCEDELEPVATRVGADRLDAAADRGVEIEVEGDRASAGIRHLRARLHLSRVGGAWRIAEGHQLR